MQSIDEPSDILSMKMLNNAWAGVKTIGREFLTEPVGNLINSTGDKIGKAGLLVSAAVPPVGGSMIMIGGGMEVLGSIITVFDGAIDGNISSEAINNLIFDASFELLPAPMEAAIEKSGAEKQLKETAKFQLRAVTEVLKDKTQDIMKSSQISN
jgi:hypothetical protein